jgi:hypothetical protein
VGAGVFVSGAGCSTQLALTGVPAPWQAPSRERETISRTHDLRAYEREYDVPNPR